MNIKNMSALLREVRNSPTFRLFRHRNAFAHGFTSMLEVDRSITKNYNGDPTEKKADYNALQSDWKAVGNDMSTAIQTYAAER